MIEPGTPCENKENCPNDAEEYVLLHVGGVATEILAVCDDCKREIEGKSDD